MTDVFLLSVGKRGHGVAVVFLLSVGKRGLG